MSRGRGMPIEGRSYSFVVVVVALEPALLEMGGCCRLRLEVVALPRVGLVWLAAQMVGRGTLLSPAAKQQQPSPSRRAPPTLGALVPPPANQRGAPPSQPPPEDDEPSVAQGKRRLRSPPATNNLCVAAPRPRCASANYLSRTPVPRSRRGRLSSQDLKSG